MEARIKLRGHVVRGYDIVVQLPVAFCARFRRCAQLTVARQTLYQFWGLPVSDTHREVLDTADTEEQAEEQADIYRLEILSALKIAREPAVEKTIVVDLGE